MSAATTTETQPCWILTYPNGDPVDFDGEPHFATEKRAADSVESCIELGQGTPAPKQLTAPCVTISCSCCEETFGEDEGRIEHHPSIETIHSVVKDCGWIVYEDGSATCEPCSGQCDCADECRAVSPHGDVCVRQQGHSGLCQSGVGRKHVSSPEKAGWPWHWYRTAAAPSASVAPSAPPGSTQSDA